MENLVSANGVLSLVCATRAVGIASGLIMAHAARDPNDGGDVDAMIANAPHHLLEGILPDRRASRRRRANRASLQLSNGGARVSRRRAPPSP